jgi:hypothetical protein
MKKIYIYDYYEENDNKIYDNNDKFGFQIFNLIYGVYLYNLYNDNDNKCKIYYIYTKLYKLNDTPSIDKIYIDIKKKINFISFDDFDNKNINDINEINEINNKIKSLNDFPKFADLYDNTKFNNAVHLTYKMYDTFNDDDKNIFSNLNEKLISDDRLFILKKMNYSLVSIIYKNKLSYINKNKNDEIILNSPNYYFNIINILSYDNIIVIITDSEYIIKEFIISKFKYKNKIIIINNNNLINNLYLFLNAKEIVLDCSPLCFSGAYFNSKAVCYLNLIKRNEQIFYKPIEFAISDKWIISYDKHNILNFDSYSINLLIKIINNKNIYFENNENLELVNNLNFTYKNKLNIKYDKFIFNLFEKKNIYDNLRVKIHKINITNRLDIEIFFEKLLSINNATICLYLTDDIYSNTIDRLQNFDKTKVYINYLNSDDIYILFKRNIINIENYIHLLYDLNRIYIKVNLLTIDSLILFPMKSNYSIEYDFIYDYYIFYINKILNTVKNMKLLILAYSPSLLLPFTFNTLINIANHSSHYEILDIFKDYIIIIFHNIKNYNLNTNKLEYKFNNFFSNILYLNFDDIVVEIANAQYKNKSYATSYYINFKNNYKYNKSIKYKINIINFPIKVENNIFKNELLNHIYDLYDFKTRQI